MAEELNESKPPRLKLFSTRNLYTMHLIFEGNTSDLKDISALIYVEKVEYIITKKDLLFTDFDSLRDRFSIEEWTQICDDADLNYSRVYGRYYNIFKMPAFYKIIFVNGKNYLLVYSFKETKKKTCKLYVEGFWRVSATKYY